MNDDDFFFKLIFIVLFIISFELSLHFIRKQTQTYKICPVCAQTYFNDANYCKKDGALLKKGGGK